MLAKASRAALSSLCEPEALSSCPEVVGQERAKLAEPLL